ncbi:flagellar basal body P-ring formation chaperone FlgA [Bosea sp. BK604]|uniref:flagellar basal body P-ring formation chaperone FlgA n=1 Tax=Bosea sp. BK604 TaxID=2512180 RepID=UPI00104FEEFB|nr:flagellar basal body P-ring formation chaperone FlgA [Bosea sp. BK604]TCR63512.1 flagella basal body P-ring formation protein FlgA [Bosea sp. BK604]
MLRSLTILATLALASTAVAAPQHGESAVVTAALPRAQAKAQPAPAPVIHRLRLKPELTLSRDLVTFGDLIDGLSVQDAAVPAFRAPALGETGTIQVSRILEGARAGGLIRETGEIENPGLAQVVVTRAARRLTASDIEAAVKTGLSERYGIDSRAFALAVDGGAPSVAVEPELTGEMSVVELSYDDRSRRLQAKLSVPGSAATRLKPVRISGQLVETVEVVVPRRAITRGETLNAADVAIERRPRDAQTGDLLSDAKAAIDKVAKRALIAGMPLRGGDVQREEIVGRGDLVTIVYEAPGLLITMRGKSSEAGAMGDVISVTNPQSKRMLQGTVSGPGRVSVKAASGGRVASAR